MTCRLETNESGGRRLVKYQRRSTELSEEQWDALDKLAAKLGCVAEGGSRTGKPSWRSLLRLLTTEDLEVTRRKH